MNPIPFADEPKNRISFMSANFVARELGYRMTRSWMEGDDATQAFFRPEETFADRFGAMLGEVARLGFRAIDIWSAHLHPDWATERQIEDARRLLDRNVLAELQKAGYAGGLSIEHEPEDRNPLPDIEVSLQRLQAWLGSKTCA